MEYAYATLLLNETGAEINEHNLTDVLEAADADVTNSRVKALVAALEDVNVDEHAAAAESPDGEGAVTGDAADHGTTPAADAPETIEGEDGSPEEPGGGQDDVRIPEQQ